MEDRKRSAPDHPESLGRLVKRSALTHDPDGDNAHTDADNQPFTLETILPEFQKDAIFRQMKEYKRISAGLETQLHHLQARCKLHEDHIRAVHAWFFQLIDEFRTMIPTSSSAFPSSECSSQYLFLESRLLAADNDVFQEHLRARSSDIKRALAPIFAHFPPQPVDLETVRTRLSQALATQKTAQIQLEAALSRQEELSRRLDAEVEARQRLERLVDRMRSPVTQRVDSLPHANSLELSTSQSPVDLLQVQHADLSIDPVDSSNTLKDAQNLVAHLRHEISALQASNEKLAGEVSRHLTRLATLSDDDYSHTDLYKSLKAEYQAVVTQLDHLVATNAQLAEFNRDLEKDRTSARLQFERDSQVLSSDLESRLAKTESDLVRVRQLRDDYLAQVNSQRALLEELEVTKSTLSSELMEKSNRILSMGAEIQRLRLDLKNASPEPGLSLELQSLSHDAVCHLVVKLRSQQDLLTAELSAMATAYQKASALASDKSSTQRRLDLLLSHKAKADEKTFASMKRIETLETENRTLRSFHASNTDLVSKLKESDQHWKALCSNLEEQLSSIRMSHQSLVAQHLSSQQRLANSSISVDTLNTQVAELKKLLSSRDSELSSASCAHRAAEIELEVGRNKLIEARKTIDMLRRKPRSGESQEELMLRHIAYCTLCKRNLKDTVLKSCGHVFCNACVQERITSRSRKCPYCMTSFGVSDYRSIILDP